MKISKEGSHFSEVTFATMEIEPFEKEVTYVISRIITFHDKNKKN